MKPFTTQSYNAGMGGVNMMDRKIYQIASERPCQKYRLKIFLDITDITVRNSYEIFCKSPGRPKVSCQDCASYVVEGLCTPASQSLTPVPSTWTLQRVCMLSQRKQIDFVVCSDRATGSWHHSRHDQCVNHLKHFSGVGSRKWQQDEQYFQLSNY